MAKPDIINKHFLKKIINNFLIKALLFYSLVLGIGLTSYSLLSLSDPQLFNIKIIAILVILCQSAHQNNSNYFSFLITLYIYFTNAKVDAITLITYLRFLILYKIFLSKICKIFLMNNR